jgi:hypothetical protein
VLILRSIRRIILDQTYFEVIFCLGLKSFVSINLPVYLSYVVLLLVDEYGVLSCYAEIVIVQDGLVIVGLLLSLCQVYHDNYGSVFVPCGVHCLLESQFRICMKYIGCRPVLISSVLECWPLGQFSFLSCPVCFNSFCPSYTFMFVLVFAVVLSKMCCWWINMLICCVTRDPCSLR